MKNSNDKVVFIVDKEWSDESAEYEWFIYNDKGICVAVFSNGTHMTNWVLSQVEHYGDRMKLEYRAIEIPVEIKELLNKPK